MIVGCYTLDLYCRYSGHSHGPEAGTVDHGFDYFENIGRVRHQFTGTNEQDCLRQARKAGWVFRGNDTTCPRCVRMGRR